MVLLIIAVISILGAILGKYLFQKWINHLTIYSVIWGVLVFLYELKLLPYVEIIPLAWFFIASAFVSFLLGILTIIAARNLYPRTETFREKSDVSIMLFADGGKTLKYLILVFSTLCLFAAIQNWFVLIDMFGSIPGVLLNASTIYRLSTRGEVKGIIPYLSFIGYVAIFFSAIYTAYKRKFSLLTFFPFIGILIKELATVGRAGMLFALMEFLFTFFLFRHHLNDDSQKRFKFSKRNAIFASTLLVTIFIVSASLVRVSRSTGENFAGASSELRSLKDNLFLSPSIYLYFSSDVGVLSEYLRSEGERTGFGYNTFLSVYNLLAKFRIVKRTSDFQRGYYIPMWTNTGTYIRELHADFGIAGVFWGPFLIGLIITWLWFRFYEYKNLAVLAVLVYLYLIVGFSFLVMVTRLLYWIITLTIIIFCTLMMENRLRKSKFIT